MFILISERSVGSIIEARDRASEAGAIRHTFSQAQMYNKQYVCIESGIPNDISTFRSVNDKNTQEAH